MTKMQWIKNNLPKTDDKNLRIMTVEEAQKARRFHESFPQYQVTPLANLTKIAHTLGLEKVCVKDESYRFGLNAFKVLGGSYAIAKYIAKTIGKDVDELPYEQLTSKRVKEQFGQTTFFSATDGNHGRGVAWAANRLGQKCVIRMPVGSTEIRRQHIEEEGAECTIETVNYDDCVRMVAKEAEQAERGVVIQDTAWKGYEEIPAWIMQGYSTMGDEAADQFAERPTHIFVQAGVGSLAGAIIGYFTNRYRENPPIMVVVEAAPAACLYQGAVAGDGNIRIMEGEMQTIMAGLCCGEPNITAWDILKNHVHTFLAVDDSIARFGMRMLAAPQKGDQQVISGESGAAPFGALAAIMTDPAYQDLRENLHLGRDSKVLLFSTEGDTDPDRWKRIVWEGKNC